MQGQHAQQREQLNRKLPLLRCENVAPHAADQIPPCGEKRSSERDDAPETRSDQHFNPVAVHHGGSAHAQLTKHRESTCGICTQSSKRMLGELLESELPPAGTSAQAAERVFGLIAIDHAHYEIRNGASQTVVRNNRHRDKWSGGQTSPERNFAQMR